MMHICAIYDCSVWASTRYGMFNRYTIQNNHDDTLGTNRSAAGPGRCSNAAHERQTFLSCCIIKHHQNNVSRYLFDLTAFG